MLSRNYTTVTLVLIVLNAVIGQQTDPVPVQEEQDCQQSLLEEVFNCVSQYNIDFNVFIVMVSEQKDADTSENATEPAIVEDKNTTEFRDQVCKVRESVMKCILNSARTLISTPACAKSAPGEEGNAFNRDLLINDQRYLIKEQMEAIIGQYDVFCAHPCRISLLDDMRKCYKDHDLDPKLFISTESSGPVIGEDSYDVRIFCENRQSIVSCLRKTRDDCEESQLVLSAIGLDLDLMDKGFTVLCDNQDAYLQSLKCFKSHTAEVGFCHSIKYRQVITVAARAREHRWTQEKYYEEICEVILRHIQCDMDAWADKDDEECREDVLGLKRTLHCSLIPKPCQKTQNETIQDTCNPKQMNFNGSCGIQSLISLMIVSIIFSSYISGYK